MGKTCTIKDLQLSVRAATAAILATVCAQWLQLPHPLYALISAVVVTELESSETRKLGLPRLFGTCIGASLGAIISMYLPSTALNAGIGVFVAMLVCHFFSLEKSAKFAGYVCGIIILSYGAQPWHHAVFRTLETILGILAAILVSLIPRLLPNNVNSSGCEGKSEIVKDGALD